MPKKTAYSRGGAQRSKTKQKSFQLVRPVSDEKELEAAESSEEANVVDAVETADAEVTTPEAEEVEVEEEEEEEVVEVKEKEREKAGARAGAKANAPASITVPATPSTSASGSPKSASARLAARRQAAQKAQRSTANLILAENYGYVRKDLVFILILAVIMFAVIIVLHFVLGS
jgi:hypothetical protein